MEDRAIKSLAILGSTGSIGESALKVVDAFPDRFRIVALAAGRKVEKLAGQVEKYRPALVAVRDEEDARTLRKRFGRGTEILSGQEGLLAVALHPEAHMLLSALVGAVGLAPTYAALSAGRDVAVANKETLVIAGEAVMKAAKKSGARILPVDSEHSAIFQAIEGRRPEEIERLILTASGGPFRGKRAEELAKVPPETALKHPKWSMGPKISIDSATLMNKGLEVIEAHWLFGLPPDKISVTIHPQSIIHSMVEFIDGSILAQMGVTDMRGPIGYALYHPGRLPMEPSMKLDLWSMGPLTFEPPDMETFPCLKLAYDALKEGGTAPAVLSGANEIAVESYLEGKITFGDIPALLSDALAGTGKMAMPDIETALRADRAAREFARRWVLEK